MNAGRMYLHHPEFKSRTTPTSASKSRNIFSQPLPKVDVSNTKSLRQVHSEFSEDPPTPPVFLTKSFRQICITPEKVADPYTEPKQASLNSHNDDSPQSPDIPVFNTPGIPQIKKAEINMSKIPMAPLDASCMEPFADNDSPVPPVLVTPGVKQIKKDVPAFKVGAQPVFCSKFLTQDDDLQAPTPPEFLTRDFSVSIKQG